MDTISIISACVLALSALIVDDYAKLKTWPMTLWQGLMVISAISLLIHPFPLSITIWGEICARIGSLVFALFAMLGFGAVFHVIAWIFAVKSEKITDFLAGKKRIEEKKHR